jgi:hypothetical protein
MRSFAVSHEAVAAGAGQLLCAAAPNVISSRTRRAFLWKRKQRDTTLLPHSDCTARAERCARAPLTLKVLP